MFLSILEVEFGNEEGENWGDEFAWMDLTVEANLSKVNRPSRDTRWMDSFKGTNRSNN